METETMRSVMIGVTPMVNYSANYKHQATPLPRIYLCQIPEEINDWLKS